MPAARLAPNIVSAMGTSQVNGDPEGRKADSTSAGTGWCCRLATFVLAHSRSAADSRAGSTAVTTPPMANSTANTVAAAYSEPRRRTAQLPGCTLRAEASKIWPIEASRRAWNCSPVCWSDSPSSRAREKLAIMAWSLASNEHAWLRL